jgi:membrane protease YdiL (CAAX protease family)
MYDKLETERKFSMSASNVLTQLKPAVRLTPQPQALRPLSLWPSLLLSALPAVLVAFSFYIFQPFLENAGYSPLISYLASMLVPTALLFAGALIGYHRAEGRPLVWSAFSQRMRFPALTLKTVPALSDPRVGLTRTILDQMAGGAIAGHWEVVLLYLVAFFFNIAGEELWWRGYLLPRQELAFGKSAWLLHGLLWTAFHAFKWWDMLGLLPVCLAISFSAQRLKNNWPALIAHALFNGLSLLAVIAAVAGLI